MRRTCGRLMLRRQDLLTSPDERWAERILHEAISAAEAIALAPPPIEEAMVILRRAKDAAHLSAALADLSRTWPLMQVTGAMTKFADASLRAAMAVAAAESAKRGDIVAGAFDTQTGPAPGVALIAMGKMGAGELNYSSDIDFSVFFDSEKLAAAGAREPRVAAVRLVAPLVRTLEEVTPDGYVFRTDLRLRPDPGSTPVAVSIASAEHYYQNARPELGARCIHQSARRRRRSRRRRRISKLPRAVHLAQASGLRRRRRCALDQATNSLCPQKCRAGRAGVRRQTRPRRHSRYRALRADTATHSRRSQQEAPLAAYA
ncbi:MAG: hypothetical protein IPG56_18745 [Caulobacteraceae bacterium]|nr:hypothetical protein [Caulobacteraceae bacterium]